MIRYRPHAEQQMQERGIDRNWVEETVANPDWTEQDPRHPGRTRSYSGAGWPGPAGCSLARGRRCSGAYGPSGPAGKQEAKAMIRTHYDLEADAFAIHFAPKEAYVESQEVAPGLILDFDAKGQVIGIEVLDVSRRMASTAAVPDVKRPAAE
jgi:uncharacterized protein YuzE